MDPEFEHHGPVVREQIDHLIATGARLYAKRDEAPEYLSLRAVVEFLLFDDEGALDWRTPLLPETQAELMTVGLAFGIARYLQLSRNDENLRDVP